VTTLTLALMIMTSAIAAQATVLRAFVSSTGNDANAATNCAQSAPCRTFAGALPTVTAGGELIALDSAGYGPLTGGNTVNKAITIAAVPGATGFVVAATGTSGFTITGAASDLITLRNLSFNGTGAGTTIGVTHNSGKLVVDSCEFTQNTTAGLRGLGGTITVRHCTFNGNAGRGVYVSGTAKADLVDILIVNNGTGITADGNCANTFVRLDTGMVVNNTLGFEMLNAVCAPNGGSLPQNISVHNDGGIRVTIIGNTNTVGPSPGVGLQAVLNTYSTVYFQNY